MQRKLMGLLMFVAVSAYAQNSAPLTEDDPAVWEARAARAKSLRQEAGELRHAADAQRAQDDIVCRKRFFENACKDSARERWIERINKVRTLEIEAVGLERNQRAHEIAIKEKERAANPPRPPLILPETSAPLAAPEASPRPAKAMTPAQSEAIEKPKPAGKPIDKRKQAEHDAELKSRRAQQSSEAAVRAEQARKDAARYDERAAEHARKQAEKKAKQDASAPAAQSAPAR
ncbi:hypothetical protein VVD49_02370 [Uliginosibacterium sp. H3]|uniref:Uncharacterized protein n=1 Tax=Uliginosibacterium silvisoli TaxID=3114758 RepID=A0ABU6JZ40_9RHOO|nr:hypothetical protein [Uliginosibacterium sp. H3]